MKRIAITAAAAAAGLSVLAVSQASAQSCGDLWYRRNAIYAEAGYCFQTARARSVFGAGCFPPFGQLTRQQRAEVEAIQAQERYLRCPQ